MTDRSIFVRLGAIASGLKQGFKEAEAAAKQTAAAIESAGQKAEKAVEKQAVSGSLLARAGAAIGTQFGKAKGHINALSADVAANREQFERLSTTATVVGGLLVAGAGVATARFADFDQQMSNVAATGADARASLGALRAEAIKLGADTVFSAGEAAQGIENLLKAGVSAKDVLGGGLSGALNLAAAGQLSVADAAEISATALTQFGLSGDKMTHVADLLAAGAGKAQGEVSDLAQALQYVGPVAAGMGVSIEETTGALAAFASQGLIGEQAGTSLRGVLASMTSPSAAASKEIERLGINLYDSSGKFRGLANVAGQLAGAYSKMSDQSRDASLGIIFGNAQVTAARVLFDQGADGVAAWTKQVDDAGYAATAAATRMDNLKGDIERLSGSIDSALIESGSGLNEMLRGLTQSATSTVDVIGSLPEPVLQAGARLTALAGVGTLATGVAMKGVVAWVDYREALKRISTEGGKAGKALSTLTSVGRGVGLALAAVQVASIFGAEQQRQIDATRASLADYTTALADAAKAGNLSSLNKAMANLPGADGLEGVAGAMWDVHAAGQAMKDGFGWLPALQDWFPTLVGMKGELTTNREELDKLDQSLALSNSDVAVKAFQQITQAAKTQSGMTDQGILELFPQYQAKLQALALQYNVTDLSAEDFVGWMKGQVPGAIQIAMGKNQDLTNSLTGTDRALVGAGQSGSDYANSMFTLANAALKLSGSQIGFEQAVDDTAKAIKKNGRGLDLNTEKGRANQRALDQLATSGDAYVQNLVAQGATGDQAAAVMERVRKKYIESAIAAGASKTKAKEMADAMGLIPKDVKANVDTNLNQDGIDDWKRYKPPGKNAWITPKLTKTTLNANVVYHVKGGPGFTANADGGILVQMGGLAAAGAGLRRAFADGGLASIGSQQPQIRPYSGPQGITWSEEGSGPWEAFVSGHPAKIQRSREITSIVAQKLGGVASFADGGIRGIDPALARLIDSGRAPQAFHSETHYHGPTNNTTVNSTTYYPQAEPTSVTTNRALQTAAAVGKI